MATKDHRPLYPDIQAAGGLGPALEAEFTRMGVTLDVHGFGAGSWAMVKAGSRTSQVTIAIEERLIMPSFSSQGIGMGNASSPDLAAVAEAIATWLTRDTPIADMEQQFPFFKSSDGSKAFEAGRGVDHAWGKMDGWVARDLPRLTPLVETAKRRPKLRQLLPFTSHESLHFSRCTGYPYTNDVAHAIVIGEGQYRALGPGFVTVERAYKSHRYREADYDVLGEGDAEHVIGLIVAALPEGCGPALPGTAEKLERDNEA